MRGCQASLGATFWHTWVPLVRCKSVTASRECKWLFYKKKKKKEFYVCTYFWLCWVFIAELQLHFSSCRESGYSLVTK